MCTPLPPVNWLLPAPKKWTVTLSNLPEVAIGDEIQLRIVAGNVEIEGIHCPSTHVPTHPGTGWAGTACAPVSARRAEGVTQHPLPVAIAIESCCRVVTEPPPTPPKTINRLTCLPDGGNPGSSVCWIAEDG